MWQRALALTVAGTTLLMLLGAWLGHGSVSYVQVIVEWRDGTSAGVRAGALRDLTLELQREDGPQTAICILRDPSPAVIQRILTHPAIARTRYLDPRTLQATERQTVTPAEWLTTRYPSLEEPFGPSLNRLLRRSAVVPAFAGFLLVALLLHTDGRRWLARRIPVTSPVAADLFRVALAIGLARFVTASVHDATLRSTGLVLLGCFAAGLLTRPAFAAFAATITVAHWDHLGDHDLTLPIRTVWLLTIVPWGHGFGVDRWWRGRRGAVIEPEPSRRYGLATWIPILMLGLSYAAAVFAKLDESGVRWITGGAVRYIFVLDAANAPTSLGRQVAASELLPVLVSGAAIAAESLVMVAALVPRTWALCLGGAIAVGLHVGFYLFQGVWWWGWWALLPAFAPWDTLARLVRRQTSAVSVTGAEGPRLQPVAAAIVAFAVLQQPVVSLLRFDHRFLVSDFSMYADINYESKDAFARYMEEEEQPPPQVRLQVPDRTDGASVLSTIDADERLAEIVREQLDEGDLENDDADVLRSLGARYRDRFNAAPPRVAVLVDDWRFDWTTARFEPRQEWTSAGVLDLDAGTWER